MYCNYFVSVDWTRKMLAVINRNLVIFWKLAAQRMHPHLATKLSFSYMLNFLCFTHVQFPCFHASCKHLLLFAYKLASIHQVIIGLVCALATQQMHPRDDTNLTFLSTNVEFPYFHASYILVIFMLPTFLWYCAQQTR